MEEKQKVLLVVMMDVDPEYEEEFNRWYDEEHVPELLKVPGVLSARRYKVMPDQEDYEKLGIKRTPKYLAIYEHESVEVQRTEAYKKARFTHWTSRMRSHFKNHMRNFYVQISSDEKTISK